jgi:purine-binding chemotaxis protein CheW
MRGRLALPPRGRDSVAMSVVLRRPDGALSLLVDRIGDVIEVARDSLLAVPHTVPSSVREVSRGIIAWERDLLLLLDTDRVIPEDMAPKVRRKSDAAPSSFARVSENLE